MGHSWELVSMISCPYKELYWSSSLANYKAGKKNLHLYNFFSFFFYTIPLIFSQERLMWCVNSVINNKTNINGVPALLQTPWGMHVSGNKMSKVPAFMGPVI